MDDVEFGGALGDRLQHDQMGCQVVTHCLVEAQGTRPRRYELCLRHAVAAGEQRDVMPDGGELVGDIGNDALGAAIELGWDRLSNGEI
jgi:hypothetical protein